MQVLRIQILRTIFGRQFVSKPLFDALTSDLSFRSERSSMQLMYALISSRSIGALTFYQIEILDTSR